MTAARERRSSIRRLVVVTTPELAPGYRLAGVATLVATSTASAFECVRELIDERGERGILAVHEPFLQTLDAQSRRRLEESTAPLVVALPAGAAATSTSERRERLLRVLWQAVGYHITFRSGERE